MKNTNRRSFIARSTALAGLSALAPGQLLAKSKPVGANEKIVVAGIGIGRRGRQVLSSFLSQPDVQFVAIADVQERSREIVRKTVNRHYGNEDCVAYDDMRQVFERDDIDAVLITTGDRWHGTASVMAARAGKDIYCEKPCTMSIDECRQVDEAVRNHQRIYQGGMQRRNVDNFKFATQLARSGKLGALKELHAGILLPVPPKPDLPAQDVPPAEVIRWDAWVGPAPAKAYNEDYLRTHWRGYEGFSAGWGLHDWASHTLNLCQWAAGADDTMPVEYWFENDQLLCRYQSGLKLVMRVAGFGQEGDWLGLGSCPVRYIGEAGWVEAGDKSEIAFSDPVLAGGDKPAEMYGTDSSKHVREFLDSVKSRKPTAINSSVMRTTEVACHASAISWKLGRRLKFDPKTEEFVGDDEANALASYQRREPYTIS